MLRNASRHVCQRSLGLPDIVPKSGFPFRRLTSLNIEGLGPNIFSCKGFVCPPSWTSPQKKNHGFMLLFSPTLLFTTSKKPTKDYHPPKNVKHLNVSVEKEKVVEVRGNQPIPKSPWANPSQVCQQNKFYNCGIES